MKSDKKAISLLQPWAGMVVIGAKTWETRSWKTEYRGDLYIHASKRFIPEFSSLMKSDPFCKFIDAFEPSFYNGAIIGKVELTDCISTEEWFDWTIKECWDVGRLITEKGFGDYDKGRYAWKLENPVLFKTPVFCKGALSLWNVDKVLVESIQIVDKIIKKEVGDGGA